MVYKRTILHLGFKQHYETSQTVHMNGFAHDNNNFMCDKWVFSVGVMEDVLKTYSTKKLSDHHANLPLEMYSLHCLTNWETPGNSLVLMTSVSS